MTESPSKSSAFEASFDHIKIVLKKETIQDEALKGDNFLLLVVLVRRDDLLSNVD